MHIFTNPFLRSFSYVLLMITIFICNTDMLYSQATLPTSRTVWNGGEPTGWMNTGCTARTTSFACSGNNARTFDDNNDRTAVSFSNTPDNLTFKLKKASMSGASQLILEESDNNSTWIVIGRYGTASGASAITDCQDIIVSLSASTRYIRWTYTKATGNCDIDDVSITAGVSCTTPTSLVFEVQPSNVEQNLAMTAVKVKAVCSGGIIATGYTGNITLTLNVPGCGYTAQTVAAVNGVATFSNVKLLRSPQSNLRFTASASGFTSVVSNIFNVTSPGGSVSTTTIIQNDFDANTAWAYTYATTSTFGSGGMAGVDIVGVVSEAGTNVLRKSYSVDNGSGEKGSVSTITFGNVTGLSTYDEITFGFNVLSFGSGTGSGNDSGEDFTMEVSTNGGSSWTTILIQRGGSNRKFAQSNSPLVALSLTAVQTYSSGSQSAFKLTLSGVMQFRFRFSAGNNRSDENWAIDNAKLTGIEHSTGTPFNLPTADASAEITDCSPEDGIQLSLDVNSFQPPLTYSWVAAATLNNGIIQNPIARPVTASQSYTVTITDGHNCKATDAIMITVPGFGGIHGLWTGAVSSDWFDCRNWDDKKIPSAVTDVVINQNSFNDCEIVDDPAECRSILITSNNNVHPDLKLSTTGSLLVAGQIMIDKTAGSGTSQLIMLDNAQLNCSDLIIKGYMAHGGNASFVNQFATASVIVNGHLMIEIGGELNLTDGDPLTPDGIVQLKGNYTNNAGASDFKEGLSTLIFNGNTDQEISIIGTATETFYNLEIDKSSGNISLSDNVQVQQTLLMKRGNILTNANILELGTSLTAKGVLDFYSGFVVGKMRRWFDGINTGASGSLFPMGVDQSGSIMNRNATIEFTDVPTAGGHLTVAYIPADMGTQGLPIAEANTGGAGFEVTTSENSGYWKIDNEPEKLMDGKYTIICTGEGYTSITDLSKVTLLKRVVTNSPDWFCPGIHIATTGTMSMPVVARKEVTGWSNFGFGRGVVTPLPVTLTTFSASCEQGIRKIEWKTASEHNADYFIVEKTADGINWQLVGKVKAVGNSGIERKYDITDASLGREMAYYRLSQYDLNGAYEMFNPISIDCINSGHQSMELYPNPNDGKFVLELTTSYKGSQSVLYILTAEGKMIYQNKFTITDDFTTIHFDQNDFIPGIYFLQLIHREGGQEMVKFIVK